MTHAPIPWKISMEYFKVLDREGRQILLSGVALATGHVPEDDDSYANAQFIVKAVNSHEIYEGALCRIAAIDGPSKQKEIAREALEKARSK